MDDGLIVYILVPSLGVFIIVCTGGWCLCKRKRSFTRRGVVLMLKNERRPHMMIYSVAMQDIDGSSLAEYLRNTRQCINQSQSSSDTDVRTRQRQLTGTTAENDYSEQNYLPSYDDVIFGKFGGNVEPPSYIEAVSRSENNGK